MMLEALMPFVRVDAEAYDEMLSELDSDAVESLPRPTGGFEYESAEAQFKPAKLGPVAKALLDELIERQATAFRACYDGGYDEGFAHPDYVAFGDQRRDVSAVAQELANSPLPAFAVRAAASTRRYGSYAELDDLRVIRSAFDELAHELASLLLGDGYGTGEYQLYGAFTADLVTGRIADDPAAITIPESW
jgi:hypothetical protein